MRMLVKGEGKGRCRSCLVQMVVVLSLGPADRCCEMLELCVPGMNNQSNIISSATTATQEKKRKRKLCRKVHLCSLTQTHYSIGEAMKRVQVWVMLERKKEREEK